MSIVKNAAVVTGAGSGVGRAVALLLARQGWHVAIVGRRSSALQETVLLAGEAGSLILPCPCDITSPEAVDKMAQRVLALFEKVDALVNAAGTNTPKRSLAELTYGNYQHILETNLTGAYLCTQAFLPVMRKHRCGTVVNVISDAAKQASPKAGPAYVASKFGLAGLTQSINAEEKANGIRACALLPGDIDTPLLNLRPNPPSPEQRQLMMQPEDVAQCAWLAISLPQRVIVEEILFRPR
jgi:NAD(P)-dependent dehydrogenase (short-subunit alcohol dehydrogenase family)